MEALQPNISYHIFNHANGFENVFREDENFHFFLEKYRLFISPIAETYAYCLLPNHFHLVIRIHKLEVIEELIRNKNNFSNLPDFGKVSISDDEIEKYLSRQFSSLFLVAMLNRLTKCINVWDRFLSKTLEGNLS